MSQIEFEQDEYNLETQYEERTSGLIGLLKKTGLAKNDETANKILIGIGIVSIILTIIIISIGKHSTSNSNLNNSKGYTIEELREMSDQI